VDVVQTHDYIKLHCESYIDKILLSHGWTEPGPKESTCQDMVPLSPVTVDPLQHLTGPLEGSKEHTELENKVKFSYQGLLGELLYAFIIIHIEISSAIQFLSKFSMALHLDHYLALKNLCHYHQKHKKEGLIYWCTKPLEWSLPPVLFDVLQVDPQLPSFQRYGLDELVTFADASYATDIKTLHSVTGYVIIYAGAAIAYKAKLQTTVATSLTEAEFIAAVFTTKVVKHLHSICFDRPETPTSKSYYHIWGQ